MTCSAGVADLGHSV